MNVLPTPTGPSTKALWPASMKRSEHSSSQIWCGLGHLDHHGAIRMRGASNKPTQVGTGKPFAPHGFPRASQGRRTPPAEACQNRFQEPENP